MRINPSIIGMAICLAAGAALSPLTAEATTVTWNFNLPSGQLGTSETYNGVFNPSTGEIVSITAYGYKEKTTTGGDNTYDSQNSYGPTPTDLYGKTDLYGTSEDGLGIAGDTDNEIDYTETQSSEWGQTITTVTQSFVQIDLTNVLTQFPNAKDATITIGSLQNPDTAVLSYSDALGTIGTKITDVSYKSATGAVGSTTISLSNFSLQDPYLTISSIAPASACSSYTSSVLLNSFQLSYSTSTPTPEPAASGLLGFAAMGLLLIPRRRTR
jgi:hypothetical protein